jgi:hypothetical protein
MSNKTTRIGSGMAGKLMAAQPSRGAGKTWINAADAVTIFRAGIAQTNVRRTTQRRSVGGEWVRAAGVSRRPGFIAALGSDSRRRRGQSQHPRHRLLRARPPVARARLIDLADAQSISRGST